MPSISPLAQRALDAIQAAIPVGEAHIEHGQALINLVRLVPYGSALARALHMENVWSSGFRDQHLRAWSGKQGYSYLQRMGTGGFQMHYFLEGVDKARASEGVAQTEERHIARALVGDDWNALRDMGVNGKALFDEVSRLDTASVPAVKVKSAAMRLEGLHPLIDKAAAGLYADEHYGEAIFAAFKAVENRVQTLSSLDLSGRDLVAKAFGGNPPPIRIAASHDRRGQDEQEGFRFIFMGAMQGIRNLEAHGEVGHGDAQRSLEYLALASLLMRRLDDAERAGRK